MVQIISNPFYPSLIFAGKAEEEKPKGRLLLYPTNIRLKKK
jgi:hypothetical protein